MPAKKGKVAEDKVAVDSPPKGECICLRVIARHVALLLFGVFACNCSACCFAFCDASLCEQATMTKMPKMTKMLSSLS